MAPLNVCGVDGVTDGYELVGFAPEKRLGKSKEVSSLPLRCAAERAMGWALVQSTDLSVGLRRVMGGWVALQRRV